MKRRRREQGGGDVETHNTTLENCYSTRGTRWICNRASKKLFSFYPFTKQNIIQVFKIRKN